MAFGPIVSAGWLASHLDHDGLQVVDCRSYLGEPDRGSTEYRLAHIRGAVYMDLEADLSTRAGPGRHPLPDSDEFMATLGRSGIEPGTVVVAYDDRGGAIAARLWWMMRDVGHAKVAVLDGGLADWRPELMDDAEVVPVPTTYVGTPGQMPRVDRAEVESMIGSAVVLDARAGERYRGESEPIDAVAGHMPTAKSAPLTDNLGPDGRFKPAAELRIHYGALGVGDGRPTVSYCGSGVTACHNILAMEIAGVTPATLYPGSWSDWATAGMPVAVGPDPGQWPV